MLNLVKGLKESGRQDFLRTFGPSIVRWLDRNLYCPTLTPLKSGLLADVPINSVSRIVTKFQGSCLSGFFMNEATLDVCCMHALAFSILPPTALESVCPLAQGALVQPSYFRRGERAFKAKPCAMQTATSPAQPSMDTSIRQSQEAMPSSYTPIPNALFDHVMPTLSGSEWQLLCVIIRQTIGWHDPSTGARKTSDWLSHRQLKTRTGRGSDAVCHAIESLVRKGHIEVKNEQGDLLATPPERRRNGSRLFYGIGLTLRKHFASSHGSEENPRLTAVRKTRIGKAETTKETPTKTQMKAFGKPPTPFVRAGAPRSKSTMGNDECGCLLHSEANPQITGSPLHFSLPPSKYSTGVSRIVAAYKDLIQNQKNPNGHFSTSLNQEYIDRLEKALSRYDEEQLLSFLEAFFESDFSLMKRNSSLASFIDSVHILATRRPKQRLTAPAP